MIKHKLDNPYIVILGALVCCILWGSAFPVLKISYQELGIIGSNIPQKVTFAGMRFFLAATFLFGYMKLVMKQSVKVTNKMFFVLLLLGILQTTFQYFFFYNGLSNTTAMKASVLSPIGNFFVVILAHFAYDDDKLNWNKFCGIVLGFTGVIVLNLSKEAENLSSFVWNGEGYLLMSGFVGAFGTILAKKLAKKIHPFLITAWQMFLGSTLLLISGFVMGTSPYDFHFTYIASGLFIYSAVLSAVAFSLWYMILKYNKAGKVSLYRFMIPIVGSILSAIFIPSEVFTIQHFMGLIFVVLGIIVVNLRE